MKITKKLQYSEIIGKDRVTFYGSTIDEIVLSVMKLRAKNKLPSKNFNTLYNIIKTKVDSTDQVDGPDSKIFKRIVGEGREINSPTRSRSITIRDAYKAATALMKIIPGDYVDKAEYQRRLLICSACPLRQRNSDCMSCGGAGRAARFFSTIRSKFGLGYKTDDKVGQQFCGYCGCSLSLLLLTKIKNYKVEDEMTNRSRPSHCWLRKDSNNYVG